MKKNCKICEITKLKHDSNENKNRHIRELNSMYSTVIFFTTKNQDIIECLGQFAVWYDR